LFNTWQNVDRPLKWYVRAIRRTTLHASDGIACANREAQELLRHQGYRKTTTILPALGVDTRVFTSDEPTPRDRFTIAFIGRLVAEKGLSTLIDAVEQLTRSDVALPVRLLIIGDGAQRVETIHYAEKLGSIVQFTPPLRPMQVAEQLHKIDVLILPSRTTPVWKEQFGRVLTEAMACRVPVIGSNSGAIPEVIGDAGLIFPEGDVAALANCLRQLIDFPDLRRDLAQRGYMRVITNYTQERIAQQTADFYRQVMKA
jgi:glycosyltransferase involved in cell wall biosynthesis